MDATTEILELKFDGNGIKPSIVSVSEIAELLVSYERSITSVIKHNHPEIGENHVFLSFDEVNKGSLSLKCIAHQAVEYVLPAYGLIASSFETQNFNQLPNSVIEDLRVITRFAREHKCNGYFIQNGQSIASFNENTDVSYNESEIIRGETTIYGEVKGVKERINTIATLKINKEYTISFEVKKEIAKQLGKNIFNYVGLKGTARWDKKTYKIIDFKVDSIIIIEEKSLNDTFADLSALLGDQINKLGDYNTYLS